MEKDNAEIERYTREMMDRYAEVGTERVSESEEKECKEPGATGSVALVRLYVSSEDGKSVEGAGIIIRMGEGLTVLTKSDVSGDSGSIAFILSDDDALLSVSVHAVGYYSVNDAYVKIRRGELLEIPVTLEHEHRIFFGADS